MDLNQEIIETGILFCKKAGIPYNREIDFSGTQDHIRIKYLINAINRKLGETIDEKMYKRHDAFLIKLIDEVKGVAPEVSNQYSDQYVSLKREIVKKKDEKKKVEIELENLVESVAKSKVIVENKPSKREIFELFFKKRENDGFFSFITKFKGRNETLQGHQNLIKEHSDKLKNEIAIAQSLARKKQQLEEELERLYGQLGKTIQEIDQKINISESEKLQAIKLDMYKELKSYIDDYSLNDMMERAQILITFLKLCFKKIEEKRKEGSDLNLIQAYDPAFKKKLKDALRFTVVEQSKDRPFNKSGIITIEKQILEVLKNSEENGFIKTYVFCIYLNDIFFKKYDILYSKYVNDNLWVFEKVLEE